MTIKKSLSTAEIERLYSAANSAIWYSHNLAAELSSIGAREEDYVATLVSDAIPILADRWSEVLVPKRFEVKVSGVFCHGHPQVVFGYPERRVELADLLVLHQHSSRGSVQSRAILVQAKMSSDGTHTLPAGDPQLELFTRWPAFEFKTGGLSGGQRDIKEVGKGSRYSLILSAPFYPEEIRWADQCPWGTSTASPTLTVQRSFAKVLGDILLGKDGRAVYLASPKDDWSKLIKELLEITGKRTYRRANISRGSTPRLSSGPSSISGTLLFAESHDFSSLLRTRNSRAHVDRIFATSPIVGNADGNDVLPPLEKGKGGDGGMSVLIIETLAREG